MATLELEHFVDGLDENSSQVSDLNDVGGQNDSQTQNSSRPNKRPQPDSPENLVATIKQQQRQIRRRNSISDLREVANKKTLFLENQRLTKLSRHPQAQLSSIDLHLKYQQG